MVRQEWQQQEQEQREPQRGQRQLLQQPPLQVVVEVGQELLLGPRCSWVQV